jgi:hypothetical protein
VPPTPGFRRWALAASLALVAAARNLPPARLPTLVVRVVAREDRRPLVQAQVLERADGWTRFTDAHGTLRIPRTSRRPLALRIRQLGYTFVDTLVAAPAGDADDTLDVALARVAWRVDGVAVRARRACPEDPDAALTVEVLARLREGAERYLAFRAAYPFEVQGLRRTIAYGRGEPHVEEASGSVPADEWGLPYRAGHVLERTAWTFNVPLLSVTALADAAFWERHCLAVNGTQPIRGRRAFRLDFEPVAGLDAAEWEGTAYVDSLSSELLHVEFRLANLRPGDVPTRLEGYTTFRAASPLVAVPESTVAVWWKRRVRDGAWGTPDAGQLLIGREVRYTGPRPPPPDSAARPL